MRFLTDENIAKQIVNDLRNNNHNVKDIKEEKLFGISDKKIMKMSLSEKRIIITHDKDFGYYPIKRHSGVIILRYKSLKPENVKSKFISVLKTLIKDKAENSLTIITDDLIKIRK